MVVLLLGGSGYIGTALRRCMEREGIEYCSVGRTQCDCCNLKQLSGLIDQLAPAFLINAAGFTGQPNVDACEDMKVECLFANAVMPGIIRRVCERRNLPWGHLSSGCIYLGSRPDGRGFQEPDLPNFSFRQNNCSFYSGSKALGEETLANAAQCYVWRIRIPFNNIDSSRNYLSKLIRYRRLLDARNSLSHLDEVVLACLDCWRKGLAFGTYNLTNTGSTTTREVVEMIRRSKVSDKEFEFFKTEEDFMRVAATTPRSNCVLDNSKAIKAGLRLSHVSEAIDKSLRDWKTERQ
jgi:dTDP-4-dehydrorhamnose reductase